MRSNVGAENGRLEPRGVMVQAGATKFHVLAEGDRSRGPTVVLEAGLTAASASWAWVQPQVGRFAYVIAYDRGGLGWSEDRGTPRDGRHIAQDLHDVLQAIDAPKPYVLVGHSLGGAFVRVYADMFPEDVGALVLVDATNPVLPTLTPEQQRVAEERLRAIMQAPELARVGVHHFAEGMRPLIDDLPRPAFKEWFYHLVTYRHLAAARDERIAFNQTLAYVRDARPLGNRPVVAIASQAVHRSLPDGVVGRDEVAAMTSHGEFEVVKGANHFSLLTNRRTSRETVRAIRRAVDAVGAAR